MVGVVHKHNAVVDDDAHQDQEAHQRDQRQLLTGSHQAEHTAGEGQRNREQNNERRQQALELRHHDKIDKNQCQCKHFCHLAQHLGDLGRLTGQLGGHAVGQVQCSQLRLQLAGEQRRVVAVGGLTRQSQLAGAVLAGNRRIARRRGAGRELTEGVRLLYAAAILVGGRRLELHIENVVQRRRVGLIDDNDAVAVAARLQRRGGGVRRQLGGDLLVDLRDGQTHPHSLVLVNRDVDLGVGGVLAVGDVLDTVDALHQRHDLLARGGQVIEVVAVEVHLDAGAGQRTHVHHAIGVHFNFAV